MAKPIKKQRWGTIDGIGLLNGLGIWDEQYRNLRYVRKPFDTTVDLKNRILRELEHPTDTTHQGLLNGLCNEFNIDPYNVQKKTTFELTYSPVPSGASNIQDIRVYYQENNSWYEVLPQIWSEDYQISKDNDQGFIVWQNNHVNTVSGVKNFGYSNLLEIFDNNIPDNSKIKIVYYIDTVDADLNTSMQLYTDMDHPDDPLATAYTYRSPQTSGEIRAYTLDCIPEDLHNVYYDEDTGEAEDFLYTIKNHIDSKFKHKWGEFATNECIWDIHKYYGRGCVPSFYDAVTPYKFQGIDSLPRTTDTHTGGVESYSDSLCFSGLEEVAVSGSMSKWQPRLYPGKFYLSGIPFYLCENPNSINITFVNGSSILPTEINRSYHTIMAASGYYDTTWNNVDPYFSGVIWEDYSYPNGLNGDSYSAYIYRHRPYVHPDTGYIQTLGLGEYSIDYENNIIYGSGITNAQLVWDSTIIPSGRLIEYDLNPMNEQYVTLDRYFMFFSLGQLLSN